MSIQKHLTRAIALPLAALLIAGCGGGNELPELDDPDQALIRVDNELPDRFVTIAVEDMAGNTVTLGNVQSGVAKNFIVMAPDWDDRIRLVAVKPGDDDRGDHVISEPFTVHGGYTVNWFLPSNRVEVSEDDVAMNR